MNIKPGKRLKIGMLYMVSNEREYEDLKAFFEKPGTPFPEFSMAEGNKTGQCYVIGVDDVCYRVKTIEQISFLQDFCAGADELKIGIAVIFDAYAENHNDSEIFLAKDITIM